MTDTTRFPLTRRGVLAGAVALLAAPQLARATETAEARVLADGLNFPEGPTLLPDGRLVVCEIKGRRLTVISPDGTTQVLAEIPNAPAGSALGADGALYVTCIGDGKTDAGALVRVDPDSGAVTVLYDSIGDHHLQGPNDLVFDGYDDIWFTDMADGRVYHALADGTGISLVTDDAPGANGIALSADGTELYVIRGHELSVIEGIGQGIWEEKITRVAVVDPEDGPDGMKLDAAGNAVVACWQAGLVVISPEGKILRHVEVPGILPTNLVFAADGKSVFVTGNLADQPAGQFSGRVVELPWRA